VVAFSDGGRLPYVLDEARRVARLFPGEALLEDAATRARLVAAVSRHGIVHLAAHGEARLDDPTSAHLRLADGSMTTADVFDLQLDGDLVTLSACETGRGAVTGGNELIGLAPGFLIAGAAAVVQSLWLVEDDSTARLVDDLYRSLRSGNRASAALRQAQLRALTDRQPPYTWAPFQYVGGDYTLGIARPVVAWLEDAESPMRVGQRSKVGVAIAAPDAGGELQSGRLDWGAALNLTWSWS
jgi:CHAT domain-containing protein